MSDAADRDHPLSAMTENELQKLIEAHPLNDDVPGPGPAGPETGEHCPLPMDATVHDIKPAMVDAGLVPGLPVMGKLLGHSQAATTHRYAHLDADPLRRAVETIGSTIDAAMRGENAGNVVALPKGKRDNREC